MTTEAEFLTSYEKIKISYTNVMKCLDQAISYEENEHPIEAMKSYTKAVKLIDETFEISVGLPDNVQTVEPEWNDACLTIHKMKSAKSETVYRLKILQAKHGTLETSVNGENSAYVVRSSPTLIDISYNTGLPKTYKEIIQAFREVLKTKEKGITFDVLFQSTAKLYKIQPDGVVSTIEGDTEMSVALFSSNSSKWNFLNGIYFIQCTLKETNEGGQSTSQHKNMMWIYPLVPQITNCFRTEYGAFIFPDMETTIPGTAFGIMLPNDSDSQQFMLDLLEAILAGEIRQIQEPNEPVTQDTSTKVSKHIVGAADFIARNLVKGAEKTGELMVTSTPYLISKLAPASSTDQPVSSKLQTTVGIAKGATSAVAGVTGWVAGKVGTASMALGRYLSPHIQNHGATLLEKGLGYKNNEAQEKMQGALTIAAGAVEGFTTVYGGLEDSAKILGNNLSNNSVKIIEHKYGASAGVVASDTFETLGNAFNISQNVNYITPKGLAKGMAKNTGKAVFVDYKKGIREESHYVQAGDLYPDLRKLKDITPK